MKCPFCKEDILEGAIKCKHCGSMLTEHNNTSAPVASVNYGSSDFAYSSYSQVPWFRQNWFAILCAFILTPALFFILVTGDVYYERKGELKKYGKGAKICLIIWSCLAVLRGIQMMMN